MKPCQRRKKKLHRQLKRQAAAKQRQTNKITRNLTGVLNPS
jgi:hypothetical protein